MISRSFIIEFYEKEDFQFGSHLANALTDIHTLALNGLTSMKMCCLISFVRCFFREPLLSISVYLKEEQIVFVFSISSVYYRSLYSAFYLVEIRRHKQSMWTLSRSLVKNLSSRV